MGLAYRSSITNVNNDYQISITFCWDKLKTNSKNYFNSWSKRLICQSDIVRDLIGDAHWLSDGHHKECLIKDFLCEYLPTAVDIGTGFVKPPRPDVNCSCELDVLVHDISKFTPYHNQGGLAVVTPGAAIAHIEVKTSFKASTVEDALYKIISTRLLVSRFSKEDMLWSGICFYTGTSEKEVSSILRTISQKLSSIFLTLEIVDESGIFIGNIRNIFPMCIFSMDDYACFLSYDESLNKINANLYRAEYLSAAIALNELFSSVRVRLGGEQFDDVGDLLGDVDVVSHTELEISIEMDQESGT